MNDKKQQMGLFAPMSPPRVVFVGKLPAFLGISVHEIHHWYPLVYQYRIGVDVFANSLAD